MGLIDILQHAMASRSPEQHFDSVVGSASTQQLGTGLADAMRSDQTPPFGSMVGQLFGNSNPTQQAGVLNHFLGALSPSALSGVAGGALAHILAPGQTQITPDQATQLSPSQVTEIAAHVEKTQPGIVDSVGQFYAQHSGLIKTLGSAALMVTLAKMKHNLSV